MLNWPMNSVVIDERTQLQNILLSEQFDFSNKYLATKSLYDLIQEKIDYKPLWVVSILEHVLKDTLIAQQRQSLFLFRKAALSLMKILQECEEGAESVNDAVVAVKRILRSSGGSAIRAVAEAAATLPLNITIPQVNLTFQEKAIPLVKWGELFLNERVPSFFSSIQFVGRCLVASDENEESLLVIKLARVQDKPKNLHCEALWMKYLQSIKHEFFARFNIPSGVPFQNSYLFRLQKLPIELPKGLELHPEHFAIAYIAHKDYFTYPNDNHKMLGAEQLKEVLFRNAFLLGKMMSIGIVHTALIPLFHNRTQQQRRTDSGIYYWPMGGRLDQWLTSSLHPNIGLTGVRDFEHITVIDKRSGELYLHIGEHLLSLFLVAGSYFRNKDSTLIGSDPKGKAVDARKLFDEHLLAQLIDGVFRNYYLGFVGNDFTDTMVVNIEKLALRMIAEMGVDRFMEERFRKEDQKEMTEESFNAFLVGHGFSPRKIESLKRGEKDIILYTGPHLGGFNQRISLPEIIDAVGSMSASCIVGMYMERAKEDV